MSESLTTLRQAQGDRLAKQIGNVVFCHAEPVEASGKAYTVLLQHFDRLNVTDKFIMNQLQVYILECCDGSYYTGVSNNVERRVSEHNAGYDSHCYTHTRRPVKCVWISDPLDPNQAIELEKQIKGWSRKKKEAIINNQWHLLQELSQNRMKIKGLSP